MLNRLKNLTNLIGSTFSTARVGGEFFLLDNNFGKIYIETGAIKRIIEHIKVEGIDDIKAVVETPAKNTPLKIRLTLGMAQSYSAKELTDTLIGEINRMLKTDFEITDALINIKITQVTNTVKEKKTRRVR